MPIFFAVANKKMPNKKIQALIKKAWPDPANKNENHPRAPKAEIPTPINRCLLTGKLCLWLQIAHFKYDIG